MRNSRLRVVSVVLLSLALAAACEGDPTGTNHTRALEITTPSAFVDVGQTLDLGATARDASGSALERARLTWSSSNPSVLEVTEGKATGRAPGTAYVRVTAGAVTDSLKLTVEAPVAQLVVWPADTLRLIQGRRATLFVEMSDAAGRPATHSIEVTSSAPGTVAVQSQEISGATLGPAVVTVRAGTRSVKLPVEVVTGKAFTFRSLGSFSPASSPRSASLASLNNRGWIAGTDQGQAALWRNGQVTALPHEGFSSSVAHAVNDSGTVVGTGVPADGSTPVLWTWRAGVVRRIPLEGFPGVGGPDTEVLVSDLNNRGEFIGRVTVHQGYSNTSYFFYWDGTRLQWPTDPARWASAINDRGVMVGGHSLIENGAVRQLPPPRTDVFWTVVDINNQGRYLGFYSEANYLSFYGEGDTEVDLRAGPYFRINNYGEMLGHYSGPSSSGVGESYLRRGSEVVFVASAGVSTTWGAGLNDLGQVVVVLRNSPRTAYLASPA